MAFVKKKIFTTPIGTCAPFPYLDVADTKYNDRGVYKADVIFPNDARTQAMIDAIVKCHEEHYAEVLQNYEDNPPKTRPSKKPLLPYEGDLPFFDNGDGTTTFKFNSYGSYTDKKTGETKRLAMPVVDSQGKRYPQTPKIFGGSELKIRFSMVPYTFNAAVGASVKLQLEGAMIVTLSTFGGDGGDEWADEVVEGGAVASDYSREDFNEGEPQDAQEGAEGDDPDGDF